MEKIGVIVDIKDSELFELDGHGDYDLSTPLKKMEIITLDPSTNKLKLIKTISHNIDNEFYIGDIVARRGRLNYVTKNIKDFDYMEIDQLTTIYEQLSFLKENVRKIDILELLNSSKTLKKIKRQLEEQRRQNNIESLMSIDIVLNSIHTAILNSYNGKMKKRA